MHNFLRVQTTYIVGVATASAFVVGAYILSRSKKEKIPIKWKEVAFLEQLHLYPLKSGRKIDLETADCTDVGIMESIKFDKSFRLKDRSLVVYSSKDKEAKTARTHPKLLLIEIETTDMNYITINAPNMRTLFVKIPNREENEVVNIIQFNGEPINSIDCGDEAGHWFSQYLIEKDEGMRLAYNDGKKRRNVEKYYPKLPKYYKNFGNETTGLHHDIGTLMLMNQVSVDDLNQKLDYDKQISTTQFRPNFIINGKDLKPFVEDDWDWIKIGDVIVRSVMECTRCMMTTINQETTERNKDMEPLKTLNTFRKTSGPQRGPPMGIYLKLIKGGEIKRGDKIYVGTD
ncbi:unnamed protein product [Brassicogethes aeneus]|uniref:MOSC domain-containing protein n=1 Tax=Brassicogethes aeneus TaxID=1431903 RepID=A0A9P0BEG6_BRAAE|nr:unnamed protein product [Brassicogethes aeneus]